VIHPAGDELERGEPVDAGVGPIDVPTVRNAETGKHGSFVGFFVTQGGVWS